jgi:hypothetical protein
MTVLPARIEALCQATIWKFLEGVDILKRTIYDSLILKKSLHIRADADPVSSDRCRGWSDRLSSCPEDA